jgi:hypothetical protein
MMEESSNSFNEIKKSVLFATEDILKKHTESKTSDELLVPKYSLSDSE